MHETDISARTCLHIAQATRPQRLLIKPGMGFDERLTINVNEMRRTLSIYRQRPRWRHDGRVPRTVAIYDAMRKKSFQKPTMSELDG